MNQIVAELFCNRPLCDQFPRNFASSNLKEGLIADFGAGSPLLSDWNLHLRHSIGEPEMADLNAIFSRVSASAC